MTGAEQRTAAKFAENWKGRGNEKQETQRFWIELLTKVFGVDGSAAIAFEVPVKLDHTSFIDDYIAPTRVLIEQKGQKINLRKLIYIIKFRSSRTLRIAIGEYIQQYNTIPLIKPWITSRRIRFICAFLRYTEVSALTMQPL